MWDNGQVSDFHVKIRPIFVKAGLPVSLQDRVKNPPKSASYVSPIDRWIATLPKEEAEAAKQMLLDPKSWSQRSIIEAFREEGHRTSLDTVSAWRRMNNVTGR